MDELHLLSSFNQQNKLGAREEVQALCDVNLILLIQFPCLLSLFLLHLSFSKVNDTHFLAKSNNVALIPFILIFLLALAALPNYSLEISLSKFKFHNAVFPSLPFLPSLRFLTSSLLVPSFPINPDSHQISGRFIYIFIIM